MKIEDDEDDIQVQDLGQDQGVDQDRAIVDAGEDHPPEEVDLEQELDRVNDHGHAKRRFQKNQLEVENILRIQMMISQSNLEKIVSWIGSNVILGIMKIIFSATIFLKLFCLVLSENLPWQKKIFERKMKINQRMNLVGMKDL